jgi:hypothetical protein
LKQARKELEAASRVRNAAQAILEIGKRDMSNPKYDGYFTELREAIACQPKGQTREK